MGQATPLLRGLPGPLKTSAVSAAVYAAKESFNPQ